MFDKQNNNKEYQNNTNTRGIQFMNKDGHEPSTLVIGYWNELVSIKFHPALPKEKQTENKVYDYEQAVSTALTIEKVVTLLEKIQADILPAIKNNEQKAVGVQVGGNSVLMVSTGKHIDGENVKPYIALHKSLSEDTKKPEASIMYEFVKNFTVDDYDAQTGEFTINSDLHSEFLTFLRIMTVAVSGLSNAHTHSNRHVNKYANDTLKKNVEAIGAKVGADIATSGYKNNGYKSASNVFTRGGGNTNTKASDYEAPSSNIDNAGDLDDLF